MYVCCGCSVWRCLPPGITHLSGNNWRATIGSPDPVMDWTNLAMIFGWSIFLLVVFCTYGPSTISWNVSGIFSGSSSWWNSKLYFYIVPFLSSSIRRSPKSSFTLLVSQLMNFVLSNNPVNILWENISE